MIRLGGPAGRGRRALGDACASEHASSAVGRMRQPGAGGSDAPGGPLIHADCSREFHRRGDWFGTASVSKRGRPQTGGAPAFLPGASSARIVPAIARNLSLFRSLNETRPSIHAGAAGARRARAAVPGAQSDAPQKPPDPKAADPGTRGRHTEAGGDAAGASRRSQGVQHRHGREEPAEARGASREVHRRQPEGDRDAPQHGEEQRADQPAGRAEGRDDAVSEDHRHRAGRGEEERRHAGRCT